MKLLGDFFVWEKDCYTYTLDRSQIAYTSCYCPTETGAVEEAYVWANQHAIIIQGANATEFWRLWAAYLEEEEQLIVQMRKTEEERQAREVVPLHPA